MKAGMKKALSLMLVLCLIVTLFAGLAATVGAATFSYNSGKRDTVCTSLSSKAQSYYTGSYTYSTLASKSASSLKSSLKTLMTNTHTTKTSYDNLKTYIKYSDANAGSSSKIVDFYSSATYSGTWDNGSTWNREHVWCQSLGSFTTSNCGSDLHHLRPADPTLNSTRNNLPFGEVSGSYKTAKSKSGVTGGYYTSSCFEPLDNVKGDVARILLYCHVRWGESNLTDLISSTTTLLNWMQSDPVDTWEMGRNDVVQGIQGNRNVFIDYPEFAWLIYSKSIPSHTTPSGIAKGSSSGSSGSTTTYTVTASSNNSSYGTVSVSGYKITCSPKSGYQVNSVTVLSGTCTTSISGNTVTVKPSTDCSIRVNFGAVSSGSTDTSSGSFTLVTSASQLQSGDKVIIVASGYNYAMSTTQNTNNRSQTAITKSSGSITPTSSTEIFTLGKSGSYYTFYDTSEAGYLRAASSSSNYLKTGTLDDNAKWSISISGGEASVVAQGTNTRKYMRYNAGSSLFSCYSTSSSQYAIAIYRQGSGSSSGSTSCSHSSTTTSTTAATCTSTGKTTVTCKSCGAVVSTSTIAALGHNYKYSSNNNGTHSISCSRCSYSSSGSCSYSGSTCKYCGYTQSSSSGSSSSDGNTYELVTSSSGLTAGTYIILAAADGTYAGDYGYYALTTSKDGSYAAMSASGLSYTSLPTTVTCSDSAASDYEWVMTGSRTSFTLSSGSNYLISASGSTKLTLSTSSTTWAGTYSSSYKGFTVKGNSRYISLRDDISTTGSNGLPLFCTVSSSSSGSAYLHFYKLAGSSSGSTSCSHSSTSTSTTAATCTSTGKTTVTCKSCGEVVSTSTIAALGHNYSYTSNSNGTHKITCSRCTYSSSASCTYSNSTCKYCGYTQSTSSGSTSTGSITSGQYVIAAKVGSTYYAMSNSFASKITASTITVTNGMVSAADAADYAVTITKSGSYYTISNGSSYLKYSSSSNFASSTTAYNWSIGTGTNGSYRITASGSSTRGIVFYRSYTRFGAYSVSNATAGSSYYYDVELLPIGGSSSGSSSGSSGSSSSDTYTYELVTSASDLTAGTYIIIASADGTYAGDYSYYALTTSKDGSYAAMSAAGLSLSSLPTSLTCGASSASAYEWTLSGSRTSMKLASGSNYLAGASGSTKLTLSTSATTWSGTYSSSYQGFSVKANSRYISLRDDISTTGSNGAPLFCTVSSTSTGTTYLHFYKLVTG